VRSVGTVLGAGVRAPSPGLHQFALDSRPRCTRYSHPVARDARVRRGSAPPAGSRDSEGAILAPASKSKFLSPTHPLTLSLGTCGLAGAVGRLIVAPGPKSKFLSLYSVSARRQSLAVTRKRFKESLVGGAARDVCRAVRPLYIFGDLLPLAIEAPGFRLDGLESGSGDALRVDTVGSPTLPCARRLPIKFLRSIR